MRPAFSLLTSGVALLLFGCGGGSSTAVPTATLTLDKAAVNSGEQATLTWTSTNATSCAASGGWTGSLATSGSQSTGALTAATDFTVTCAGNGGTSAPVTTTVHMIPTATLTADPTQVAPGTTSTLTWNSTNASSCTASGGWTGTLPTSGSQATSALNADAVFSLTCSGDGGNSQAVTAGVSIVTAPTATLTANPTVVAPGGTSVLTWKSINTTTCTASGGWTGTLAVTGTQDTGALSADKTYTLVCTGTAGMSPAATATVSVSNTVMGLSPGTAAITLTQTQQFTATVPGGGSATWTVDGVANGNALVGAISANGLYTPGTAAGPHTVVATSAANTTQSATSLVAVSDLAGVYTYHNDLARDGANTQEYALTKATVSTAHFGKLTSCAADGAIYVQPLWVPNLTIGGAKHNVVFVATQHNGVFAYDAEAVPCKTLWSASLLDASHGGTAGETTIPAALVGKGYGNIQPEIGITGTPVIDPATNILYVVTKSINSSQTTWYQRLHAIDLLTGAEKAGSPSAITATYPKSGGGTVAFDPRFEHQRSGLAFANGMVYIPWASHEDQTPYYGWMMAYQYSAGALTQKNVINFAPNQSKAGVWMSGAAPPVDANNQLYVITGNGDYNATSASAPNNDYGDSLLKLSPTLTVSQYFTPSDQDNDNAVDKDFGSGGAAILADLPAGNTVVHAIIAGGKDTTLYVINRDLLGGFGDQASVQQINFGTGIFSTGALWNNMLYLTGAGGPLQQYQLNPANANFSHVSQSSHIFPWPGATSSVSASSASQNGILWTLDQSKYCTQRSTACGPVVLYAYDATDVSTELWDSSQAAADAAGYPVKFTVPTIANGRVYVPTRGNNRGGANSSTTIPGELDIYGLK
jgi:hypothetical protein